MAHTHGTNSTTNNSFLLTKSTSETGRRSIKPGSGTAVTNNVYNSEAIAHATATGGSSAANTGGASTATTSDASTTKTSGASATTTSEASTTKTSAASVTNTGEASTTTTSGATNETAGTNKNMQPYIVVNRWHRTA